MTSVMSVKGLISEEEVGFTLPHEHLFIDLSCYWRGEPKEISQKKLFTQEVVIGLHDEVVRNPWAFKDNTILNDPVSAINEAGSFIKAGGRTIVDVSPYHGIGRNPHGLLTVSQETGANVIMSSGRYSEPSMADEDKRRSIADLEYLFYSEFVNGVENSGIKPGLLKVGFVSTIDKEPEIRSLRAAARVQNKIGCALSIHPHIWDTDSHLLLDMAEEEGCDLRRVILCHQDYLGNKVEYLDSLVKRGAYIEFDTFGSGWINDRMWQIMDHEKIIFIKNQIAIGNVHNLLISGDMCLKIMLSKWGGKGLGNIPSITLNEMKEAEISDELIHMIVVENPRKVLCH